MDSNSAADPLQDQSLGRALTRRYLVALSLVAALSTAAWWSMHLLISEQKTTALLVNVSGRQRMLSQRTTMFSELLEEASVQERPALRMKLKDSVQLMERSHRGLIHGDAGLGLPATMSATVHSMYFDEPGALDAQVQAYINAVNGLLAQNDEQLNHSSPQLQYILNVAPTMLLKALDRMVGQYQLEGETSVNRLQALETTFWGITLMLLVLEALLIFNPMVRHVRSVVGKLQDVSGKLLTHQGQLEQLVEQRTDELEKRSAALAESEEKFRLVSSAANDAIVIIDSDERVIYCNPAAVGMLGYACAEAMGMNLHQLIAPERFRDHAHRGFKQFRADGTGNFIGKTLELSAIRKDGQEFPIDLSISAFKFQGAWHAMGIIRDITERKITEEQVRILAFYDELTKLPNRRLLIDRVSQAMSSDKRNALYSALMFIDLDNFKPLNDVHGHVVGDLLLMEAATRLTNCVRESDTVARFGGDEYVVLLNGLSQDKATATSLVGLVAEKVRASLSDVYVLADAQSDKPNSLIEHRCTASIGVIVFGKGVKTPHDILKWADAAMYEAKAAGRNSIRFFEAPDEVLDMYDLPAP